MKTDTLGAAGIYNTREVECRLLAIDGSTIGKAVKNTEILVRAADDIGKFQILQQRTHELYSLCLMVHTEVDVIDNDGAALPC